MILPAAPVRFRSGDSEYAYRPDSELFYLTGWEEPNAIAVFRGFGDDRFVLFVQPKDENAELWGGPRIGPERAVEEFGADAAYPIQEFSQRIDELLQSADRIYYRLGSHDECDTAVRRGLSTGRTRRPRYGRGPHLVADPGAILDRMRLVKDQAEIARLREAASVTTAGVADGLAAIRPGVGEWEVEAALLAGFRKRGGDGASFAPIVGSGVNACTLHYVANNDVIGEQDLVLIDAGASLGYYAGDITRTVPASGSFTPEQRQLYDVVLRAQRKGLDRCGPGVTLQAIHDEVAQVLYEGLVALGVLSGDEEDLANPYYPHRTSHWLGLDTHDVGPYVDHDGDIPLEPGMVLTVEPGLYLPPGRCPRQPAFEGMGIRIEDDVLITANGAEVLTENLPTDPDQVCELVGTAK